MILWIVLVKNAVIEGYGSSMVVVKKYNRKAIEGYVVYISKSCSALEVCDCRLDVVGLHK